MVAALQHTGNESNKRKLLLGRKWGSLIEKNLDSSKWDAFIERAYSEGIITKEHMDFVQGTWDIYAGLKGEAQKAHKDLYGFFFNEITAQEITTPFGVYEGGYVPAFTDKDLSLDARLKGAKNDQTEGFSMNAHPSTGEGFTKKRVTAYNEPLSLDLMQIRRALDSELKFIYLQPTVKELSRLARNMRFGKALQSVDEFSVDRMLIPFLGRLARQSVVVGQPNMENELSRRLVNATRRAASFNAFALSSVNILQNLIGLVPSVYYNGVGNTARAFRTYMQNPSKTATEVSELSSFMRTENSNLVVQTKEVIERITLQPSKYALTKQWIADHVLIGMHVTQSITNNTIWMAGYNKAIAEGKLSSVAVSEADQVVRTTQGSKRAEMQAAIQEGGYLWQTVVQYMGYFNAQGNMLQSEIQRLQRDGGLKKNYGRLFYATTLMFILPAIINEILTRGLRGELDKDEDGKYADDVKDILLTSPFNYGTAMVPLIGQGIRFAHKKATKTEFSTDRLSPSPLLYTAEAALGSLPSAYAELRDKNEVSSKTTADVMTLLSVTGIPIGAASKNLKYVMDVEAGKIKPKDDFDYIRGVVTGSAGKKRKYRD